MRVLWLLLALAACAQEAPPLQSGPYVGGGAGTNARIGGGIANYYSFTR